MMFLSLPSEVDTTAAIEQALSAGKQVVVGKVFWDEQYMVPVRLESLAGEMEVDRYGVRCPKSAPVAPVDQIDLVVMPGLGFDTQGNRLGRGGGYYDRFLSSNGFRGLRCGFGFEEQVLDMVPVNGHDVGIDIMVTDEQVRHFNSR